MGSAIELDGLNKRFGNKVAVSDFHLTVPDGAIVGLIGRNGAGKTTTIRMIMSIIFPDSGAIRVLGKASAIESKDRIGYLPEERGLYKKMRVGTFLEYVAKLKGIDSAGLSTRDNSWLDRVELGDCYRKKCEELSKGMQQKVQFIASVINEPDLLILDEPFSGLDPVNSRLLRSLVNAEHKRGCTLIFSTHQMTQAEALCDRIVMIEQGRKVLDNTLDEVRSRYTPREIVFEPARGAIFHDDGLEAAVGLTKIRRSNGVVHASFPESMDGQEAIRIIASAVPVQRIELVRPTLEDVFIEIVSANNGTIDREALLHEVRAGRSGEASGD